MDTAIYTLEVPPELRDRAADLARREGTTVSEIVRAGMAKYCEAVAQGAGIAALHKNNKP